VFVCVYTRATNKLFSEKLMHTHTHEHTHMHTHTN